MNKLKNIFTQAVGVFAALALFGGVGIAIADRTSEFWLNDGVSLTPNPAELTLGASTTPVGEAHFTRLSTGYIIGTSTGSSTFAGGINLSGGCFAIGSVCLSSGTTYTGTYPVSVSGSVISFAFSTTSSLTWSGAQIFNSITRSTTTSATSTNLHISGSLTEGTNYGKVTASTTVAMNLGSTTLDAMGKSFNAGTSTFLIKNDAEPFMLVGFFCKASTTGGTGALVRTGDNENFTETGTCDGTFTRTLTNNTWTAFEDFVVQASSTAGTVSRMTITFLLNKI